MAGEYITIKNAYDVLATLCIKLARYHDVVRYALLALQNASGKHEDQGGEYSRDSPSWILRLLGGLSAMH
jgi:hypothetical protein